MNRFLFLFLFFCLEVVHAEIPFENRFSGLYPTALLADSLPPAINCPVNASYQLSAGTCDTLLNYTVVAYDNEPGFVLTQESGLPTNSPFPIGATINSFLVTDVAGNTASCSFTVLVQDYAVALICADVTTIELGADCTVIPDWSLIVENEITGCPESYLVEVDKTLPFGNGPWVSTPLTLADINKTYVCRVRNIHNSNVCTGNILVKDKQSPNVFCEDIFIPCEVTLVSPAFLYDSLGIITAYPQIVDNCGAISDTGFISSLFFEDEYDPETQLLKFTRRLWSATDENGNQGSCEQFIYQTKSDLADVLFPKDTILSCSDSLVLTPAATGRPYIIYQGLVFPLSGCAIAFIHSDSVAVTCGQAREIYRKWFLLDSETAEEREYVQRISVQDVSPPQLACPAQLTVTVEAPACNATVSLPDVVITDGCSHIASLEVLWMQNGATRTLNGMLIELPGSDPTLQDTLGVLPDAPQFPIGTTLVTCVATDACGNTGSCQWEMTVLDMDAPLAVCDTLRLITLGPDGKALLPAASFDGGSEDACLPLAFKVKLQTAGDCQAALAFDDQLLLCCGDQGDTLRATLRVYDIAVPAGETPDDFGVNHFADCTARIVIRDTLPVLCDNLPDITVHCADFDPSFALYGEFPRSCAVDSFNIQVDYSIFDTLCRVGSITRTFNIVNAFGQSAFCLQQLTVDPEPQYYYVRFPDDLTVSTCAPGSDYGMPEVFQLPSGCEYMQITFADVLQTNVPDACFEIRRTWRIHNICTYNSSLPYIIVPNPQVASGPIVSELGTTGDWSPTSTAYANIWSANSNGYEYTQRIRVIDAELPLFLDCPANALLIPDSTDNSTLLWNENYWLDVQTQATNMSERSVDLRVSAKDLCSGGDVDFKYVLFLDLDNDEVPETVVESDNLPGFNTVRFNNYGTPNNAGGTARQFDQRPVPAGQKWGFALEVIHFDTGATAALRFNSLIDPDGYVLPQLPHGKHRIRWIIEDACGNEALCEYEFTIRDVKAPELVCPDDITVYFEENPGIATLYIADVLWSTTDNATPSAIIRTSLRLAGTGAGFPDTILQNIPFSCLEDANTNQVVEVWVKDVAGNTNFCDVNVHIDSCNLALPEPPGHITGILATETGVGIKNASVLAFLSRQTASISLADTSDMSGIYDISVDSAGFGDSFLGGTAAVFPYKNTDPLNGVSTFDLLLISRHILGLDTLDSPYKIIAADANKSGQVTTFDVVELRKLILGVYEALPDISTWRFVPARYDFPNPIDPFQTAFPESDSSYYFLNGGNYNFIGLKVGDVNNSVDPQSLDSDIPERRENALVFQTRSQEVEAGEELIATFSAAQRSAGVQFTLAYQDLELLEIVPGKGMSAEHFASFPEKNRLTLACENSAALDFSLRFRANRSAALCDLLQIGSDITPAAAWLPLGKKQVAPARVALQFTEAGGFSLFQNRPNPFVNKTSVSFQLPKACPVTLQVMDATGRLVWERSGLFSEGLHSLDLELPDAASGVYYYQLEAGEFRALRRMIRL